MEPHQDRDTAVQRVKDSAQIAEIVGEYVSLQKAGANLKGLCPFHTEKTPSFTVSPVRQSFHCFGCGEGGDVFTFMMKYHRMTFPEALQELAKRYGIELPRKRNAARDDALARKREDLFAANEFAASLFSSRLLNEQSAEPARKYLQKRGLSEEIINTFRLGYAPKSWDFLCNRINRQNISQLNATEAGLLVPRDSGQGYYDRFRDRIIFPIFNLTGKIIGFGGRILGDGQPKYLNTPETLIYEKHRTLFGLYQNKAAIREQKKAILVEGNFDLLSLVDNGVKNVAAPLGTALTQAHVRLLKGLTDEVILLFDGDSAGLKAALRSVPIFLEEQVSARVAVLPGSHDPDTYIREFGRKGLLKLIDKALPLPEFTFEQLIDRHGLSMEGKGKILEEIHPLLEEISSPLKKSVLISQFSDRLQLDQQQINEAFHQFSRNRKRKLSPAHSSKPPQAADNGEIVLPRKERQLLEFLILYPEYVQPFLDAGIAAVLTNGSAKNILHHMKEMIAQGLDRSPEMLLEVLPEEGPLRTYVSKLLITAPVHESEDPQEDIPAGIAAEQLAWLARNRLRIRQEDINRQILAAQQKGDDEALTELFVQKIKTNQALAGTDGDNGE